MATNGQFYSRVSAWRVNKKAEIMRALAQQRSVGNSPEVIAAQWELLRTEQGRLEQMQADLTDLMQAGVEGELDLRDAWARSVLPAQIRAGADLAVEEARLARSTGESIDEREARGRQRMSTVRDALFERGQQGIGATTEAAALDDIGVVIEDIWQTEARRHFDGMTDPVERAAFVQEFAQGVDGMLRLMSQANPTVANAVSLFDAGAADMLEITGPKMRAEEYGPEALDRAREASRQAQMDDVRGVTRRGVGGGRPPGGDGPAGLSDAELLRRMGEIDALSSDLTERRRQLERPPEPLDLMELERDATLAFQERYGTDRARRRIGAAQATQRRADAMSEQVADLDPAAASEFADTLSIDPEARRTVRRMVEAPDRVRDADEAEVVAQLGQARASMAPVPASVLPRLEAAGFAVDGRADLLAGEGDPSMLDLIGHAVGAYSQGGGELDEAAAGELRNLVSFVQLMDEQDPDFEDVAGVLVAGIESPASPGELLQKVRTVSGGYATAPAKPAEPDLALLTPREAELTGHEQAIERGRQVAAELGERMQRPDANAADFATEVGKRLGLSNREVRFLVESVDVLRALAAQSDMKADEIETQLSRLYEDRWADPDIRQAARAMFRAMQELPPNTR